MKHLPYLALTSTGDSFEIDFPLHTETQSAVRVSQLISTLLKAIDGDIQIAGETSNGDVLQALAMTLAVRVRMIPTHNATLEALSTQLLQTALKAVSEAKSNRSYAGHA